VGHLAETTFSVFGRKKVEPQSKKTLDLGAGETLYIEMVPTPGVGFYPSKGPYTPAYLRSILVDAEQAEDVIRSYHYVGPDLPIPEPQE
jgi:hypothetical protein